MARLVVGDTFTRTKKEKMHCCAWYNMVEAKLCVCVCVCFVFSNRHDVFISSVRARSSVTHRTLHFALGKRRIFMHFTVRLFVPKTCAFFGQAQSGQGQRAKMLPHTPDLRSRMRCMLVSLSKHTRQCSADKHSNVGAIPGCDGGQLHGDPSFQSNVLLPDLSKSSVPSQIYDELSEIPKF